MASAVAEPQKVALITGITGQDGSYLAEFLLSRNYAVHGMIRRSTTAASGSNMANLRSIEHRLILHQGDLQDSTSVHDVVKTSQPDEIYNMAAQSHVTYSFKVPDYTLQVNMMGVLNLLQAVIHCDLQSKTRIFQVRGQASSSEMFGGDADGPLDESTPFNPQSPYAISKVGAFYLIKNYRASHKLYAVNGISFNHESARRGRRFVTMRVAYYVAKYHLNLHNGEPLTLAGVYMQRDWGHARDYVECMWMMLQQPQAEDVVISTEETHSVQELVENAFQAINVSLMWQGQDSRLKATNVMNGEVVVKMDESLIRPTEVRTLRGNSAKARRILGWKSTTSFEEMVHEMVHSQIDELQKQSSV